LSHESQRCVSSSFVKYISVFFFFEFSVSLFSPIWVENYVSTSSKEGDCVPLEVLGGMQNTVEEFGGIEGKV